MSDRGICFTSKKWSEFAQYLGCIHKTTTAYHPSSNGAIERVNRTLNTALKAQLAAENWMDVLPTILLGLRSMIREDLGSTTCEMVYGMNLHLPSQFFDFQSMPPLDFAMYREQQKAYLHNFNYIYHAYPPHVQHTLIKT